MKRDRYYFEAAGHSIDFRFIKETTDPAAQAGAALAAPKGEEQRNFLRCWAARASEDADTPPSFKRHLRYVKRRHMKASTLTLEEGALEGAFAERAVETVMTLLKDEMTREWMRELMAENGPLVADAPSDAAEESEAPVMTEPVDARSFRDAVLAALEFYAENGGNCNRGDSDLGPTARDRLAKDRGRRAREALEAARKHDAFRKELEELVNRHGMENVADVPDFIVAEMICRTLEAVGPSLKDALDWHGTNSTCHPRRREE